MGRLEFVRDSNGASVVCSWAISKWMGEITCRGIDGGVVGVWKVTAADCTNTLFR